jgi:hypothetical protein
VDVPGATQEGFNSIWERVHGWPSLCVDASCPCVRVRHRGVVCMGFHKSLLVLCCRCRGRGQTASRCPNGKVGTLSNKFPRRRGGRGGQQHDSQRAERGHRPRPPPSHSSSSSSQNVRSLVQNQQCGSEVARGGAELTFKQGVVVASTYYTFALSLSSPTTPNGKNKHAMLNPPGRRVAC